MGRHPKTHGQRHTTPPYLQGETPIPLGRDSHTHGERHPHPLGEMPTPIGRYPQIHGERHSHIHGERHSHTHGGQKPKTQGLHNVDPAAQGMSVEPNPVSPLQAYYFFSLFRRQFHQHILSVDSTKSSIRKHHSGSTTREEGLLEGSVGDITYQKPQGLHYANVCPVGTDLALVWTQPPEHPSCQPTCYSPDRTLVLRTALGKPEGPSCEYETPSSTADILGCGPLSLYQISCSWGVAGCQPQPLLLSGHCTG